MKRLDYYFKRAAKVFGIRLSTEFEEHNRKTFSLANDISSEIGKYISTGKIEELKPSKNEQYVHMSDGRKLSRATFRDEIQHIFDAHGVEPKKKGLERDLVGLCLERYSSGMVRNGKCTRSVHLQPKALHYKNAYIKTNTEKKTITIPTLFGECELKYTGHLRPDWLKESKGSGGNIQLEQGAFIQSHSLLFTPLYEPEGEEGIDENADVMSWMAFSSGRVIPMPDHIKIKLDRISELNKIIKDREKKVSEREYRSKQKTVNGVIYPGRNKAIRERNKLQRKVKSDIEFILTPIIDDVIENKQLMCIDSVKTGAKSKSFGQNHLIAGLKTLCERRNVPFYVVNCSYTSQRCTSCGHIAKENRKSTTDFKCVECGYECDAQKNGADNLAHNGKLLYEAMVPYGDHSKWPTQNTLDHWNKFYEFLELEPWKYIPLIQNKDGKKSKPPEGFKPAKDGVESLKRFQKINKHDENWKERLADYKRES